MSGIPTPPTVGRTVSVRMAVVKHELRPIESVAWRPSGPYPLLTGS
jgi:hypothetical protein